MKFEMELHPNFVSDIVVKQLQEMYEHTKYHWFDTDPEEARAAILVVLDYFMPPSDYAQWRADNELDRNLAEEVAEGFDHLRGLRYNPETGEPLVNGYPLYSGLPKGEEHMISNGYYLNERGQHIDRFDLEQAIMNSWQVVEDLGMLYNNLEKLDSDQLMAAVDGLKIYANMRQEHLWDTFEEMLHNERQDKLNSEVKS